MSQGSTDGIAHVRALLTAIIESEWRMTASWPIDTEHQNRTRAQDSVSLHSSISIILVCRPRENSNGEIRTKCQSTDSCSEEVRSLWHAGEWYLASVDEPSPIFNDFRRISAQGACGISTALTLNEAIATCLRRRRNRQNRRRSSNETRAYKCTYSRPARYNGGGPPRDSGDPGSRFGILLRQRNTLRSRFRSGRHHTVLR
jgi:hypothetical protein